MEDIRRFHLLLAEFSCRMSSWEHAQARARGMSASQTQALFVLGSRGGVRMRELSGVLGVTAGTVSVLIRRLEELEMVRRRADTADRRAVVVDLTEKGRRRFRAQERKYAEMAAGLLEALEAEDRKRFVLSLEKMLVRL